MYTPARALDRSVSGLTKIPAPSPTQPTAPKPTSPTKRPNSPVIPIKPVPTTPLQPTTAPKRNPTAPNRRPPRPRSVKPPVVFPFTDAYVRALPRRTPANQPTRQEKLTDDQQKVVISYYAFSLHEGRETWRRIMHRSATSAFAARRYVGDLEDADLAATEALVECCRRWPLPCPKCAGLGKLRDTLRGTAWTCGECQGSGKPRNDFTAFHAYLRQAVNQKVLEEVNKRVKEAKGQLDAEKEGGGENKRNGKRVRTVEDGAEYGPTSTDATDSKVGHVWPSVTTLPQVAKLTTAPADLPIYRASNDSTLPARLRRLHTIHASDYPMPTEVWALSNEQQLARLTEHYSTCSAHPHHTWPTLALEGLRAGGILIVATFGEQVQVEALAIMILGTLA